MPGATDDKLPADKPDVLLPLAVGLGTMCLAAHVSGIGAVFPLVARQLGVTIVRGQSILTAYTLAMTACLLTFGLVADRIGLKRVYIAGMAVYGISSAACAFASGAGSLVLMRAIQGIGAAMVSATSVALLGAHVPRSHLGRALGWQTGITYVGLVLGPVAAGYLLQRLPWRTLFLINVPAAGLAIAALLRAAPSERWRPAERLTVPSISSIASPAAAEAVYYLCLYAIGFLMPVYLIQGRGLAAAEVGAIIGCQSIARVVWAPVSGRMCDHWGARVLTCGGILLLATSASCMYCFGAATPVAAIAATLALLGTGAGLFTPANSNALLAAAAAGQYGLSAGILATARNLGMTLGVSAAAILYSLFGAVRPVLALLAAVAGAAFTIQINREWRLTKCTYRS